MSSLHVPRSHQVIPGARVNIVLKADQRTGRQVQGTVQHVLTRGDHHRGIKVRLTDGRVGRVQSMSLGTVEDGSLTQSLSSASSITHPTSSSSVAPATPENARVSRGQGHLLPRYHDFRLEEEPQTEMDLGAYIVPSRRKGKAKKESNATQADNQNNSEVSPNSHGRQARDDFESAIAKCPVCGEFEGDEAAVGHHVAEHFGS
ncbi:hypothetical protein GGS21DRAFT_490282 [Xylaria nigripes]|nr:hypothetical protein GGS21DRAFT_490282 [Xylaria nigripes]